MLPTTFRTPAGPTPFIFTSNVATDPGARRKGLFREMADRIYPRAAATGAPGLAGTTNAASSVIVVEKFGWTSLGSLPAVAALPGVPPRGVRDVRVDAAFLAGDEFARLAADLDWVPVRDWVQSWTSDFLRWRLVQSRRRVRAAHRARCARRQHQGPRSGSASRPRCCARCSPVRARQLPVTAGRYVTAACRAHRAPVCVYGGWNAHVQVRGITIPTRFRPSPLVVVFKSFDEERAPSGRFRHRHVRVPRHRRVLIASPDAPVSSPVTFTLDVEDYTDRPAP